MWLFFLSHCGSYASASGYRFKCTSPSVWVSEYLLVCDSICPCLHLQHCLCPILCMSLCASAYLSMSVWAWVCVCLRLFCCPMCASVSLSVFYWVWVLLHLCFLCVLVENYTRSWKLAELLERASSMFLLIFHIHVPILHVFWALLNLKRIVKLFMWVTIFK